MPIPIPINFYWIEIYLCIYNLIWIKNRWNIERIGIGRNWKELEDSNSNKKLLEASKNITANGNTVSQIIYTGYSKRFCCTNYFNIS
jgi:hypothetical protein